MSNATASTADAARGIAPRDFPTWLPAMLVKELRQGLRTRGFVGILVIFQLIMLLAITATLIGTGRGDATAFRTLEGFFWVVLTAQLLIGTPIRALGSLRNELDAKSLDLLMLTRLSAWRIVVGKWGSLLGQACLLLVAMLPYGVVRYFGGSVDLVTDAGRCLALLAGCALITAISLWASGLPKGTQVIVPIGMVFLVQFIFLFSRPTPAGRWLAGTPDVLLWCDGIALLAYFLVGAVRRIAPAAENHAPLARALALVPLLLVPLASALGRPSSTRDQFVFGAFFAGVVCLFELAAREPLMRVHVQPWTRRGLLPSLLARFVMPGWPSAMFYLLVTAALVALMARWGSFLSSDRVDHVTWLAILGVSMLLFPVAVIEFTPASIAKSAPALYVIILGLMGVFAAFVANTAGGTTIEFLARMLPASSFYLTMEQGRLPPGDIRIGQFAFGFVVLAIVIIRARVHWRNFAMLARQRMRE